MEFLKQKKVFLLGVAAIAVLFALNYFNVI